MRLKTSYVFKSFIILLVFLCHSAFLHAQEAVATVSLMAHTTGKYVCADGSGARDLVANRDAIGPWEKFDLIILDNGSIAFRAQINNKYVCAEGGGSQPLIANKDAVETCTTFELVSLQDDDITLKAAINGKYVSSDSAGLLIASADAAGRNETFDLIGFSMQAGITIISPTTGTEYKAGSEAVISWSTGGFISSVKIEYTMDGTTWNVIADSTTNDGSHTWRTPEIASETVQIRISALGVQTSAQSELFTIVLPRSISVTSPNGGEAWTAGKTYAITWEGTGDLAENMILHYTADGIKWNLIHPEVPNTGTYDWVVPHDLTNKARIRVASTGQGIWDASDGDFTITDQIVTLRREESERHFLSDVTVNASGISISAEGSHSFRIIDVDGREVFAGAGSGSADYSFSEIGNATTLSGVYFIHIQTDVGMIYSTITLF